MEEALQEIKTSFQTLPSHIRDVISHASWKSRLEELALKYSLNEEQKSALITEVLLILVAIVPEEELAENIESELGVSSILAEQLTEEIGERIFTWIQKLYTEKEKSLLKTEEMGKENTLDIPPVNLPGEVMGESSNSWIPKTVPSTPEKTHSILQDQVNSFFAPAATAAEPKVEMRPEPTVIPKASFVPPVVQIPPRPQSFIANKLTQPTQPQQAAPLEIPKTYTTDPYREPIE